MANVFYMLNPISYTYRGIFLVRMHFGLAAYKFITSPARLIIRFNIHSFKCSCLQFEKKTQVFIRFQAHSNFFIDENLNQ